MDDTVSMANLDILALCCAVRNDDVISAKQLLEYQPWFAHEQIISEGERQTLLLLGCRNNAAGAVRLLVEDYGLNVLETGDIQSEDKQYEGVSPLWCAAGEGNIEIATFLLNSGAKVNQMTVTKSTPLRSACYNNRLEMVKFLIENKAQVDFPKNDGSTSLMVAAYHGHTDIVKLLLERDANVNLQDDQGASALNDACRQGHEEIVKILLMANADVNLQGKHGVTALGDACRHGNLNIINKLLDLGARPGMDERGMTPLEVAAENGHEEVIITWVCRESCSKEERVEALELLGAHFMCKRDYQKMYAYMMKAMKDRSKFNLPKKIKPPIEAYDLRKECQSVEELQAIATDVEALQYQAVILRERILGDRKMDEFPIALLGAVHADAHNYDKCMALWCRALYHLKKNEDSLTHRLVAFCEVFSEILMHSGALNRDMVCSITKTAIEEIERSRLRLKECETDNSISIERRTEDFLPNIYVSLWLLKLVHYMSDPDRYCRQVLELVQELSKQNIYCVPNSRPLLHLILDDTTPCGDFPLEMFVTFPDVTLLKQLIMCGMDVKQTDEMGNTGLHVLACNMSPQTMDKTNYTVMVRLLLEAGVHHDQTNCMNQVAQGMGSPVVTEILQTIFPIASLQCLSARVIKASGCDYEQSLPQSLRQFVALH